MHDKQQAIQSAMKIGFNAPLVEWFAGPLRELMRDMLAGRDVSDRFSAWLQNPKWECAWRFWPPVHFVLWEQQMNSLIRRRA